jgi:phospholipase D1/2
VKKSTIIEAGQNCWQKKHATRVALLIDGESYYPAFYAAIQKAKKTVFILGWDIDTRIRLIHDETDSKDFSFELGPFISEVLNHNPDLDIYILNWDWAMVYTLEREWLPLQNTKWEKQSRLHFELDGECPTGASQHQKVVVIDDEIAFSGGFDLGKHRWDSSEHKAEDARRRGPDDEAYPPFHDIQMLVEGDAAKALGDLARERWYRATDEKLSKPKQSKGDSAWPVSITPWFENIDIGIARTFPKYKDYDEVREVERLYFDSIKAAKKLIYIENQYLTAWSISKLLEERLQEEGGPDIVIVLPFMTGGWLEQATMDVLRFRVACKLKEADQFNHLRICYPHRDELGDAYISVHAKVMIIDDQLMRVGSSNLSNRSMGFDSECDLAIEATTDDENASIRKFRERLLSEHMGMNQDKIHHILSDISLIKLIDDQQSSTHTLRNLDCQVPEYANDMLPNSALVDPEKPIAAGELKAMFISKEEESSASKQWWKIVAVLAFVLAMTAIWQLTPMKEWLNVETLREIAEKIEAYPFTPIIVLVIFSFAAVLAFPVTLLIISTGLTFGPVWGSVYAIAGSIISAMIGYGIGHYMGKKTIKKLAGSSISRLSRRLAEHGILTIITVRIVPVAPFAVINLVAGSTHIKLRDFIVGTLIGMLPGILAITIFADSLMSTIRNPNTTQVAIFFGIVLVIFAVMIGLKKLINLKSKT